MELLFRFAYPLALYVLIPVVAVLTYIHLKWKREPRYRYSLATEFKQQGLVRNYSHKKVLFLLRFLSLLGLALLIARPQLVDPQTTINVEGINIIITLDISGSMQQQDDEHDARSRIAVAKEEAIRFIKRRDNDAIGLVLFANDAVSRCPLTLDKKILHNIITEVDIGLLNPDGTLLTRGLITALNRLRKVKAGDRSNIIILLTDGTPSEGDLDPGIAIEAAKQLGVKVYTVGIGSETEKMLMHPVYGVVASPGVNKKLLKHIADQTGGKFFLASSPHDMRMIYETIDKLEKVEQELPLFMQTYDIFMPFLWIILLFIAVEILLSSLIWFGL